LVDNAITNTPPYWTGTNFNSFFINVFSAKTTLTTTAPTASGTTLTVPVPATLPLHGLVTDNTSTNAIPAGTYVVSTTSNTITLSNKVTGVLSGDSISVAHLPYNFYNDLGVNKYTGNVTGGANSNSGVQEAVDLPANAGAIGYVSPDWAQPVQAGNDANGSPVSAAANLQTYYSYTKTPTKPSYLAPTPASTIPIFATITPPSFSGGATAPAVNPINWTVVNPTPSATTAYPIGGFNYVYLYSCYASATDVAALVGTTKGSLGLWRWYFGSLTENAKIPLTTLESQGFAPVPSAWLTASQELLVTSLYTKIGTFGAKGSSNTGCATATKGA